MERILKTETIQNELILATATGARGDVQTPYTCSSCADITLSPDEKETVRRGST